MLSLRNRSVLDRPHTENDWPDVMDPNYPAYDKSKALAEKAAWECVNNLPDDQKFELAVINPAVVVGPVLCGELAMISLDMVVLAVD